MLKTEIKLHYYQKAIMKKLVLSKQGLRFNQIILAGLESEHMNYHLKKLLNYNLVENNENLYRLTVQGKDYSNLMDDKLMTVEKQPKTSVIINAIRRNKGGDAEYLLSRRLRQPYYGKVGRLSGKVLFGEKLEDAVRRELYEETGLSAGSITLDEIYRKMRKEADGTFVQDVIFYIFWVTDFTGTLVEKTEFQENFWLSLKDYKTRTDLDYYDDFKMIDRVAPYPDIKFSESVGSADGF